MKKLVLHMGFHKTATSSIQETLGQNRDILKSCGYNFPAFTSPNGFVFNNHSVAMHNLFCDEPLKKYRMNILHALKPEEAQQEFKAQLEQIKTEPGTLIISAESLSSLSINGLQKVKNFFSDFDISVICFVRDAYSFHCSAIQEQIKAGRERLSNMILNTTSKRAQNILRIFPEASFYSFEEACRYNGGPVNFFLEKVDPSLRHQLTQSLVTVNQGLGNHSIRLLNELNAFEPIIVNGAINKNRKVGNASALNFDGSKFLLTESEYTQLKSQLDVENESLRVATGLDFTSSKTVFSDPAPLSSREFFKLRRVYGDHDEAIRIQIHDYLVRNGFVSPKLACKLTSSQPVWIKCINLSLKSLGLINSLVNRLSRFLKFHKQ